MYEMCVLHHAGTSFISYSPYDILLLFSRKLIVSREVSMELKRVLLERRSVRQFDERPVEREDLQEMLTAGIWSPTAGNIQPWVLFCVTEEKHIHAIQVVSPGMLGKPQALICICSDQKRAFEKAGNGGKTLAIMDCAMSAQNIMLRAYDLGLGTCVIRSFNQRAVRELLEAPDHVLPELLIAVGYASAPPPKPSRNMELLHWEYYRGGIHG
jgi:nitroreductase